MLTIKESKDKMNSEVQTPGKGLPTSYPEQSTSYEDGGCCLGRKQAMRMQVLPLLQTNRKEILHTTAVGSSWYNYHFANCLAVKSWEHMQI